MKRFLINERGGAMIQVMFASVIVAALALYLGQINTQQAKQQRANNESVKAYGIEKEIEKDLLNYHSCSATFTGNGKHKLNVPKYYTELKRKYSEGHTAFTSFQKGKSYAPNSFLYIKDIKTKRVKTNELKVEIEIEKLKQGKSSGVNSKNLIYLLHAGFNDDDELVECYLKGFNDDIVTKVREQTCRNICDTCWDDTKKVCVLNKDFKVELVREALADMGPKKVFEEADLVQEKTCSKCDKSGCNPCPSGWIESNRSCSTGSLCGLKPRWRNCKSTCTLKRSNDKFITTIQPSVLVPTGSTVRNCSKCDKNGCNPCKAGEVMSARSCNKGKTCGFKPRWRNCSATCTTYAYEGVEAIGNAVNF